MKKITIIGLLSLFLVGCVKLDQKILIKELNDRFEIINNEPYRAANQNKKYYAYYLPPSIGRLDGDLTSNVLMYYDAKFVMNLNVASIVNKRYYPDGEKQMTENTGSTILAKEDTYLDVNQIEHNYHVEIDTIGNNHFVFFSSDTVYFYAISDEIMCVDLACIMLDIARNTVVHEAPVLSYFSNKENLEITSRKIELFDAIAPEKGRIEELFEDYQKENDQDANLNR